MRWAETFPKEAEALSLFLEKFKHCPDPVLAVSAKFRSLDERVAWTLLGTCIFQDLGYPNFLKLFKALAEKFPGQGLWTLPVPARSELRGLAASALGSVPWALLEAFPGIFWSVGLFVRNHAPLEAYLPSRTPQELWRDLGEIYYMGKRASRPKACAAIFRLTAPKPLGLGLGLKPSDKQAPLPLSMGARRFISCLGPARGGKFSDMPEGAKQRLAQEFFREACPENPALAAHSLQFFLEFGRGRFVCSGYLGSCAACPLRDFCPECDTEPETNY